MKSSRCFPVIIPAAGIGSRMASATAKQYLKIQQKTILEHTLENFLEHPDIGEIVVVLHPDDHIFSTLIIANDPRVTQIVGGCERVDSVLKGLEYLRTTQLSLQQFVLVHDAARPCLSRIDLDNLIATCMSLSTVNESSSAGAILAIPVADTIKQTHSAHSTVVSSTVDRRCLWQAQTPQMFRLEMLINAIENALSKKANITDEASAIEFMHKQVILVEGQSSNIKITRRSDLQLAEFYLSSAVHNFT